MKIIKLLGREGARQFMQRVTECTKSREPMAYAVDECGDLTEFRYDDNEHRIKKITSRERLHNADAT